MEVGKKCSFWDLYQQHSIRIPQIQRDYVQGRENSHVIKNREAFVNELVISIKERKDMSLNFIYGYYEGNDFIPIDGQQRLTTLFLLHFYIFAKAKKLNELKTKSSNFSYETRYTTGRFLSELLNQDGEHEILTSGKEIQNSSWYSYSWETDPSIKSCLKILDEINKAFGEKNDWEDCCEILKYNCPIHFMLLELDRQQLGKPNQLYIRMNSRGKQLTDFENFKASMYGYVDDSGNEELKKTKSIISKNIDGEWLSLIWKIPKNVSIAEKYSDVFFRELLHWIFINFACINDYVNVKTDTERWIKPNEVPLSGVYLENYIDLLDRNNLTFDAFNNYLNDIISLFTTMTALQEKDLVNEVLSYGEDKYHYKTDVSEYKKRAFLCAITLAGKKYKAFCEFPTNEFESWFRVVKNLVNNTEIDDPRAFVSACKAINEFITCSSIEEWLERDKTEEGFSKSQLKEELFKLKIMKIDGWNEVIINAEKNDYFQGEILFSFVILGILNPSDALTKRPDDFKELWKTINSVISFAGDGDNDVLFHRVLLTYCDYSVKAPGERENIRTFYKWNERHHNYDWRGMLRPKDGALSTGAEGFKNLLEDCKTVSPKDVAIQRIEEYKSKIDISSIQDSWEKVKYYLITEPGMFEYCSSYYYIWQDTWTINQIKWNRFCLMRTSKRNAYMEALSYAEYLSSRDKHKEMIEGGDPWDSETRKSYVKIYGNTKEYISY